MLELYNQTDWSIATLRDHNMFESDLARHEDAIGTQIEGKTCLIIGGAGSIGSATLLEICRFKPKAVWIFDWNENGLADIARLLRGQFQPEELPDLEFIPADFGGPVMALFLQSRGAPDVVLNFAAVKHVRSEKNAASLLHMMVVNLIAPIRLMACLSRNGFSGRYFAVSTDKAANPSSLMGASKRVMEHVMFASEEARNLDAQITSARFANVAYSNGSLLQSFYARMARREPLVAPRDTRRYFVSPAEAGSICTFASLAVPHGSIVIPKLNPEKNLILLEDVASRFLIARGLKPVIFDDEKAALAFLEKPGAKGHWPLLVTPLDTAGEKPFEEFIARGEKRVEIDCENLAIVPYLGCPQDALENLLDKLIELTTLLQEGDVRKVDKNWFVDLLTLTEPELKSTLKRAGASLDNRL